MSAADNAFVEVWCTATWGQAAWTRTSRLIPVESERTDDAMGVASFSLLRKTRDEGDGPIADAFVPARGMYVVIAIGGLAGPFDLGEPLWAGRITDISTSKLQGYTDEIGSVTAVELGAVLDQTPVRNLRQRDPSIATGPGLVLLTNPSANMVGANGVIVGNMYVGDSGSNGPLFESLPDNCAGGVSGIAVTAWDRYSLLRHVVTFSTLGTTLPSLVLDASQDGVGAYLTTALSEVIRLDNLSLKQCIDLCVGQVRGMTWRVKATGDGWTIVVRSGTDVAVGTVPAQTATNVSLQGNDVAVSIADGGDDVWDAVEVVGQPIVCMGTVSYQDGSMGAGWGANQESAFLAGANGAGDYSGLTTNQAVMRNQAVRKSAALQDVFARFVLTRNQPTADLQCKGGTAPTSGAYAAASVPTQPLCPVIAWDGTTATVNGSAGASPYLPEAKLVHPLPWQSGVKGDGTDNRTTEQQARPDYLKPVVFRYAPEDPIASGWYDITHPPVSKGHDRWPDFSVELDGRGAALRIRTGYQEVLAQNHWTNGAASAANPSLTNTYGACDWQNLFATVAVESDQRLKVTVYAPGYDGVSVLPRNVLRIERPDLGCWLVRRYTVVGIKADHSTDEITADTFTRNDWAVAQRLANEAAAFAFRKRTGATITVTKPWAPPAWAVVGTMIGTVTDYKLAANGVSYTAVGSTTLSTIVRGVRSIWHPARPRLVVTTATRAGAVNLPQLIATGTSPSLGGPLRAAVQRARDDIADLQRTVQRIPVSVGQTSGGDGASSWVKVVKNAHGWTAGLYIARQSGGTWVTADNTGADYEPLARVMQVIDANTVMVATEGVQFVPGNAYTDLKPSWISTAGTSTETEVDGEAASAKTAKQVKRLAHVALTGGWIWLPGASLRRAHNHDLGRLADVGIASVADFDVLSYDLATGIWVNSDPITALGDIAGVSVLGRAPNSAGAVSEIVASADAQVLARISGSLQFVSIGAGLGLTLEQLHDVSIVTAPSDTRVADDFLTWNGTAWVNRNLGAIVCVPAAGSAQQQLAIDGGASGTPTAVGIGASGSRFVVSGVSSVIDFLLSGSVASNTDLCARMQNLSTTGVGFYDHASGLGDGTSTGATAGDEVMQWGCATHASASSRYFRFGIDVQFADNGAFSGVGSHQLKIHGQGSKQWRVLDDSGSNYIDFYATEPNTGGASVNVLSDMLVAGTLYLGSTLSAAKWTLAAGTSRVDLTVGASAAVISAQPGKLSFFNATPVVQQSVAAPSAVATTQTSGATYTANEQTMLANLKTDVTNLHATVAALRAALNAYGQV